LDFITIYIKELEGKSVKVPLRVGAITASVEAETCNSGWLPDFAKTGHSGYVEVEGAQGMAGGRPDCLKTSAELDITFTV